MLGMEGKQKTSAEAEANMCRQVPIKTTGGGGRTTATLIPIRRQSGIEVRSGEVDEIQYEL